MRDSVIMNDTTIGPGVVIDRAIIDKGVYITEGAHIGVGDDNTPNRQAPDDLNTGLTVIGKSARLPAGAHLGHNVVVNPDVKESDFPSMEIASGETI